MSFKFDFDVEEEETDEQVPYHTNKTAPAPVQPVADAGPSSSRACHHVTLDELLDSLPHTISYTPFDHHSLTTPLLRRDLFDARFQLISQVGDADAAAAAADKGKGKAEDDNDYVDAKSDLIPGLYEGGLKTWEGGVDLVEVLAEGVMARAGLMKGKRVLEVGCGTALPTCFILDRLFSSPGGTDDSRPATATASATPTTTLHLQDYNLLVLQLVTLPNLLLTALPHLSPDSLHDPDEVGDVEAVLPDLQAAGHLSITPTVKDAFKRLLVEHNVELDFTYGHWSGLAHDLEVESKTFDLILTAETIYAEESVNDLVSVLKRVHLHTAAPVNNKKDSSTGTRAGEVELELEDTFGQMSMKEDWARDMSEANEGVVLVAAKILYFGVGGGLAAFLTKVDWSTGIKEWTKGVGRKVVRVGWVSK